MKVLAIIQARLGSARLKNKALLDICGKPMIQHVLDRARRIRGVDRVVVAVPFWDFDAFSQVGVYPLRGFMPLAEEDVLARFEKVVAACPDVDTVVRITGDCPLLDPVVAEAVIDLYRQTSGCQYAWNVAPGYVDGEDIEVFSVVALRRAHQEATDPEDREHVTPWIRRHYPVATLQPAQDRGWLKTSVDTQEDLDRVRALMAEGVCQTR